MGSTTATARHASLWQRIQRGLTPEQWKTVAGMGAIGGWWAREEAAQRHLANRTATAALETAGDYERVGKWPEALET